MATKKAVKKAAPKQKEKWMFVMDQNDEAYGSFPSRAAALKSAMEEAKDAMRYNGDNYLPKIHLFQLVESIELQVEVKEKTIYERTIKGAK